MLSGEYEASQAFREAGLASEGPVTNLRNLIDLRDEAYELEKELCHFANPDVGDIENERTDQLTGRTFKPLFNKPPLNEMFLDFQRKVPNAGERSRNEVEVKRIATEYYSDIAEQDEFVAEQMALYDAKDLLDCKKFNDGLERNAPIKQLILSEVMKIEGIERVEHTYELSTPALQSLLTHMINQVARAKEWNSQRNGIMQLQKTIAAAELDKFRRTLEASLRTPRFNEGVAHQPAVRKPFRQLA